MKRPQHEGRRRAHNFACRITRRGRSGAGGSHEEFLEEVLGKQVLQIVVDALVLVWRTGLAHAQDGQAEMLHLDARLGGRPPGVVAALRVPIAVRTPMIMMIAWRTRGLGLVRSPITPAEFPEMGLSRVDLVVYILVIVNSALCSFIERSCDERLLKSNSSGSYRKSFFLIRQVLYYIL